MLLKLSRCLQVVPFASHRLIHSDISHLPIIDDERFNLLEKNLVEHPPKTEICRALKNMKKERISENSNVEILQSPHGKKILIGFFGLCPDVLFVRSFYENLLGAIRQNRKAILLGNTGISKSVYVKLL